MKKYKIHYYQNEEEKIVETNLDEFFYELFELYEKYDISISHEDGQGAFQLEHNNEYNRDWIQEAEICRWLDDKDRNRHGVCYSEQA